MVSAIGRDILEGTASGRVVRTSFGYRGVRKRRAYPVFGFAAYLVGSALMAPVVYVYGLLGPLGGRMVIIYAILISVGAGVTSSIAGRWALWQVSPRVIQRCFLGAIMSNAATWVFLVFIATPADYRRSWDGFVFITMAQSLIDHHTLQTYANLPGGHYGPLYPIYLSLFYLVSRDPVVTKIAILVMGFTSMATVFLLTRRLFGLTAGLIATGVVLSSPTLLWVTAKNYAEFLLVTTYTLAVYCLYRSLEKDRERYVILAGFFAGLAYLTKSSTGYFFLVAGLAGFLWRFKYARWSVFRDRNYLAAIGVFFGIVGAWGYRNLHLLWNPASGLGGIRDSWYGDFYFRDAYQYALHTSAGLTLLIALILASYATLFMLSLGWPLLREYLWALTHRGRESISLLVVATVVPIIIASLVSAMYFMFERYRKDPAHVNVFDISAWFIGPGERYFILSLVPLLWLAFEAARLRSLGGEEPSIREIPSVAAVETSGEV